jgi:hypothetical protein
VTKKLKSDCRINGRRCPECEYVHGREAEELRRAIEKYIDRLDWSTHYESGIIRNALMHILDNVDARDALAYVNAAGKRIHRRSA